MGINKAVLLTVVLFTASVNLFSQTANEWKIRGDEAIDSVDFNKAIECYQKAIEADSTLFDAHYNLGYAYSSIFENDKAMDSYYKAIAIDNTFPNAFFAMGGLYIEKLDYDKAIEMFKKGVALKPDSPEEHYYLSLLYQEKGNKIYAHMYMKRSAQLGDVSARNFFDSNNISWEDDLKKPDYEEIKVNIENEQSDFYYSKLWDKFQQGDETMTLDEKRHLYYGYAVNKKYSPYSYAPNAQQVSAILKKEELTAKEWEELLSLLNTSLSTEPFSCRYLYYQSIAYNALNKPADAEKSINKMTCIADALVSTGDGLSKETAIHVIDVSNEYDHLFLNGFSAKSQSLIDGGYDLLNLNPNDAGLEEMWFDVSKPITEFNKTFN